MLDSIITSDCCLNCLIPLEPIISSSILGDQSASSPPPRPPPEAAAAAKGGGPLSSFLKYSLAGAITGGLATAGYATYAYSLEEIDEKTRGLRASANVSVGDDLSSFEKFQAMLKSTAMTVPAKLVELYLDLRASTEEHVRGFTEPLSEKLLPDLHPQEQHVFTLYVDPIVDRLDGKHCIRYRLSRAATRYQDGKHYRDLSKLNRDPSRILYVSGNALETCLQPENCVPLKPWKCEADDTALVDLNHLIPFLEYVARNRPADIRPVLASYHGHDIAKEFIERSKEHQRRMQEQKRPGGLWRR